MSLQRPAAQGQAPPPPDFAAAQSWLQKLMGDVDPGVGYLNIWEPTKRQSWWFSPDRFGQAARKACELAAGGKNAYYGVGLRDRSFIDDLPLGRRSSTRGDAQAVSAIPALWADIDVAGPAHKAQALPPTVAEAIGLVESVFPPDLRPSAYIDSGHGLHAYWFLADQPWILDTAEERRQAGSLLRGIQATIRQAAARRGWHLDNTADLPRVLRPPGTVNVKEGCSPAAVRILPRGNGLRFNPSDFEEWGGLVDDTATEAPASGTAPAGDFPPADYGAIRAGCAFIKHCEDDAAALSEPEWYAQLGIVGRCADGVALAHKLSQPDPRYTTAETTRKLSHALSDAGPAKCSSIASNLGFSGCTSCPHFGRIKSPINLPVTPIDLGVNTKAEEEDDEPPAAAGGLPDINAQDGDLARISDLAWSALRRKNSRTPRLFRHGGEAKRVEEDEHGTGVLVSLTQDRMRYELARSAWWYKLEADKKDKEAPPRRVPAHPPLAVVADVLARPEPPLPVVTRLTECPTFAPDGTLQIGRGYHPAGRTYCLAPEFLTKLSIPDAPTDADVEAAKTLLFDEVLKDFPFKEQSDKANAVAAFLLPFVRDMIPGPTPLHVFEAPKPGSGKGLLIDALLYPSCGHSYGSFTECRDDEEWRKQLTSMLRSGYPAVNIDNVNHPLRSGHLASALTKPFWDDRILGQSATVRLPVRCMWLASANNPAFSDEMCRRSVSIRIDPEVERPWERDGFRHNNLMEWVREHRGDLVRAGLVIVQSWIAGGRPAYSGKLLGSYEHWSRVLGGILNNAKIDGFLGNTKRFYDQADMETTVWRGFVEAWWDKKNSTPIGTGELLEIAREYDGIDLGNGTDHGQRIRLGKLLAARRDNVIGNYRITDGGVDHHAVQWCLMPVKPSDTPPKTPPTPAPASGQGTPAPGAAVPNQGSVEETPLSGRGSVGEFPVLNPNAQETADKSSSVDRVQNTPQNSPNSPTCSFCTRPAVGKYNGSPVCDQPRHNPMRQAGSR